MRGAVGVLKAFLNGDGINGDNKNGYFTAYGGGGGGW